MVKLSINWRVTHIQLRLHINAPEAIKSEQMRSNFRILAEAIKKRPDNLRLRFYYVKNYLMSRRLEEMIDAF